MGIAIPVGHNFALSCPGLSGTFYKGGKVVLIPSPKTDMVFEAIQKEKIGNAVVNGEGNYRAAKPRRKHRDGFVEKRIDEHCCDRSGQRRQKRQKPDQWSGKTHQQKNNDGGG